MKHVIDRSVLDRWVSNHRQELIDEISALVSCPSVRGDREGEFPFGSGPAKALDQALELSRRIGLATRNDQYYYGLATLPGTQTGRIGVFTHMDVVPIGSGWSVPPYQLTVRDGCLIGRGVGDNKGPAAAVLFALRFLKEQGISLRNTVEVYFGCSEEAGMDDMDFYLAHNTPPERSIVPDVSFPVSFGEKGILSCDFSAPLSSRVLLSFSGGIAANAVPAEARAVLSANCDLSLLEGLPNITCQAHSLGVEVTATGKSKHAAFPEGSINAILVLCKALVLVKELEDSPRTLLGHITEILSDTYGEGIALPIRDEAFGPLTHVCGLAKTEDHRLKLNFNLRYPGSCDGTDLLNTFSRRMVDLGFTLDQYHDNPSTLVDPSDPMVTELTKLCNEVLGTQLAPYTMSGGTYARRLPHAVGFGAARNDRPRPFGDGHEPDECMPIVDLEQAVKVYALALCALDDMPHEIN